MRKRGNQKKARKKITLEKMLHVICHILLLVKIIYEIRIYIKRMHTAYVKSA